MIRKLELKDASSMLECLKDNTITQYMNLDGNGLTLADCENYIKQSWKDPHNFHFAIVDENDEWVGTISLKDVDKKAGQAEYAIVTANKVHGKGIAEIATKEILKYAFDEIKLKHIYLYVASDNVRANKFYEKFGFIFDRHDEEPTTIKGKQYYLNWYYVNPDSVKF